MDNKLKMNLQYFADEGNQEGNPGANENNEGKEGKEGEQSGQKTLTEDEVNRLIAQNKSKAKEEAKKELEEKYEQKMQEELEESKRLAQMNEEERQAEEYRKLQEELAELKKKDAYYGLSKEASKMLSEQNIQADDEILQFVVKDDAEATKESAVAFADLINRKVEEGVKKALSGKAPKFNSNSGGMTKAKIMAIKDDSKRQRLIKENIHLFK
ncbi:MAG: DUF4355 domain-containing protein [Alkalibacterium sp.]|nr:DUF4355 domain-containing protein [Alkalibacterium sp.]